MERTASFFCSAAVTCNSRGGCSSDGRKCFCDKGYHGDFCQFAPEEGVKPDDAPGSLFVGPVVEEPVSQFAFQKYVGVTRLYSAITGVPEELAYDHMFPQDAKEEAELRAEILGVRDQIAALKIKLDAQAKVLRDELQRREGSAERRDRALEDLASSKLEMEKLHSTLQEYARRVEMAGLHERAPLPPLPREQEGEPDEYRQEGEPDEYPVLGDGTPAQEKAKPGKPVVRSAGSSRRQSPAPDAATESAWTKLPRSDAAKSLASLFGRGPTRDTPAGHEGQEPLDVIDFFDGDGSVVA